MSTINTSTFLDTKGIVIREGDILEPGTREVCYGPYGNFVEGEGLGFYTRSWAKEGKMRGMPWSFGIRQSAGATIVGNVRENPDLIDRK